MFGARDRWQEPKKFGDIRQAFKQECNQRGTEGYNLARDSSVLPQPASTAATNVCRRRCHRGCGDGGGVWSGLRRFSNSGCHQPECLWLSGGEPLHRGAAEKREDDIDVRSAAALELRAHRVSPRGIVSVLVFEPASRPADEYLRCNASFVQFDIRATATCARRILECISQKRSRASKVVLAAIGERNGMRDQG